MTLSWVLKYVLRYNKWSCRRRQESIKGINCAMSGSHLTSSKVGYEPEWIYSSGSYAETFSLMTRVHIWSRGRIESLANTRSPQVEVVKSEIQLCFEPHRPVMGHLISYDSCHSVLCLYVARHDGPVGCRSSPPAYS
jgi:hypothetical protein